MIIINLANWVINFFMLGVGLLIWVVSAFLILTIISIAIEITKGVLK